MTKRPASGIYYCLIAALLFAACGKAPAAGTVKDEALTVGRMAESFPAADENYFKEMDGGVALTANEVKGRNNWIVWTGGNDRFWDDLVNRSFGAVDFLFTALLPGPHFLSGSGAEEKIFLSSPIVSPWPQRH